MTKHLNDKQKELIDGMIKIEIDKLNQKRIEDWNKTTGCTNSIQEYLKDLFKQCSDLKAKLESKDVLIKALKEELSTLKESLLHSPQKKEDASWSEVLTGKKKKTIEQIDLINVASKENSERLKKENNIIIFGVEESGNIGAADLKEKDEVQVKKNP